MATSTLGSKKPSNISRTKNVALKLPKVSLTRGYFGQFKGYIFAVLGHFCFLLRLGGCGSQGLYNRSNSNCSGKERVSGFPESGKSKWGLSKWGLKVLVNNCPRLPTIVVIFLRRKFPLERGPKRPQKCTIVDDCAQIAESGLKPPFGLSRQRKG